MKNFGKVILSKRVHFTLFYFRIKKRPHNIPRHGVDRNSGLSVEAPAYGVMDYNQWLDTTTRYSTSLFERQQLKTLISLSLIEFPSFLCFEFLNFDHPSNQLSCHSFIKKSFKEWEQDCI